MRAERCGVLSKQPRLSPCMLSSYMPPGCLPAQAKCSVHPLPFYLTEPDSAEVASNGGADGSGPSSIRQQLDAAAADAAARGIPVRGLLITNPNNPLGTIYSNETISEMLRWCLDNRVHYIRCEWERRGR